MNDPDFRLQVRNGPGLDQVFLLTGQSLIIGRYPLADIVIDHPDISYRHAVLTRGNSTYRIADLDSDSGTFVNGRRVGAEPTALSPGDIILFGSHVTAAFLGAEPPEMPASDLPGPVASEGVPDDESPAFAPDVLIRQEAADSSTSESAEEDSPVTGDEIAPMENDESKRTEYANRHPTHAGPLPEMPPPQKNNNGRIIVIAAGCLVLLGACCCTATLFMYFIGGDWILNQLGSLP